MSTKLSWLTEFTFTSGVAWQTTTSILSLPLIVAGSAILAWINSALNNRWEEKTENQ